MEIEFRTSNLRRAFEQHSEAQRLWGPLVGEAYIRAVLRLANADEWAAAREWRRWRLHALGGRQRGLWSATLHGRWRLILRRNDNTVTIEEVSNHYGD